MQFIQLDFNTVFLEKHDLYETIQGDENLKSSWLLKILRERPTKTLIYAGTYSQVEKVATLLIANHTVLDNSLLDNFADWLAKNYDKNWQLTYLIRMGTGIHTGRLHRSLSQLQIKLFEEREGLRNLVSTSSIIEGVNTCAENVIIWRNRIGSSKLKDFTYRNIIGRGGRMFKHFIGKIYILEEPPPETANQLTLEFPDQIVADIDEDHYSRDLSSAQVAKIASYKQEMRSLLGPNTFEELIRNNTFQITDSDLIKKIAVDMKINPDHWSGLAYLNSSNVDDWDSSLYKIINLQAGAWDIQYSKFVQFIKVLSQNWHRSIPQLLNQLDSHEINIEKFFNLERNLTFKFSALLNDVNTLQKVLLRNDVDVSRFIAAVSHAFLPSAVYQLEEYGLPRMLSKKIHQAGVIDLTNPLITLHDVIDLFREIGILKLKLAVPDFDAFDHYIINYFYEGIDTRPKVNVLSH